MSKNIIGFYKHLMLVEVDGAYLVVNRTERKVIKRGTEDECTKMFIMLAAEFINEKGEVL